MTCDIVRKNYCLLSAQYSRPDCLAYEFENGCPWIVFKEPINELCRYSPKCEEYISNVILKSHEIKIAKSV